jgi:hypothetical protein
MKRDLVFRAGCAFALGFAVGFSLIYGAGQVFLKLKHGSREEGALARGTTPEDYSYWRETSFEPRLHGAALAGGIVCAAACCYAAIVKWLTDRTAPAKTVAVAPEGPAGQRHVDHDLTEREFADVFRKCNWVDLEVKSPIYLQGFLVASFVESDVALATKLDRFSPRRMQALLDELRAQKGRLA